MASLYRLNRLRKPMKRNVIITFLGDELRATVSRKTNGSKTLEALIAECEVDTGISDLASQHDHYLYGKPKK